MPPITNDWADYLKEEYKSHDLQRISIDMSRKIIEIQCSCGTVNH